MKLIYSPTARNDLFLIYDYIANDNRRAAEETILRIEQTLLLVCQFPEMGRIGDATDTREFSVPNLNYKIVSRVEADAVRVLNIIHSARQWP